MKPHFTVYRQTRFIDPQRCNWPVEDRLDEAASLIGMAKLVRHPNAKRLHRSALADRRWHSDIAAVPGPICGSVTIMGRLLPKRLKPSTGVRKCLHRQSTFPGRGCGPGRQACPNVPHWHPVRSMICMPAAVTAGISFAYAGGNQRARGSPPLLFD